MESFLNEVRLRPAVWDTRTTDFHDSALKSQSWREIAEALNADWDTLDESEKCTIVLDLQGRWKNTRDYFRKLHVESIKSPQTASARKTYIYAQHLQFLTPLFEAYDERGAKPDKSKKNIEKIYLQNAFDYDIENGEAVLLNVTSSPQKEKKFTKKKYNTKQRVKDEVTEEQEYEEADRMFLLSLLPSMADIPPYMKMKTKIEILEVIHNNSQENLNYLPRTKRLSGRNHKAKRIKKESVSSESESEEQNTLYQKDKVDEEC